MTILSTSSSATNPAATEGDVKSFLGNLRAFVAELLGTDSDNKQAVQAALQTPMHGSLPKSSGYTVTTADRGKIITASAALTMNVTAAATLGDGFVFGVWAKGGAVTIDPSYSEQIDGGVTKVIGVGKCALVYCDGSAFATVGVGFSLSDLLALDGSGSGLDADLLDGYHANNLPYAGQNKNFDWEELYSLTNGNELNLLSNWGTGVYYAKENISQRSHIINVVGGILSDTLVRIETGSVDLSPMTSTWSTCSRIFNNRGDVLSIYKLRKLA